MIKSDSISNLASALVKAQAEMGNASKGSANPFFKSKYADLNAIREASLPVLAKHGLSVLQPTVTIDGKKFVETLIMHETGEYLGGHTEILAVKETDAQAQGSGISYARRYGLQSLLCIGAEDDDGEKAIGRSNTASKPVEKAVGSSKGIDVEATKEMNSKGSEAPKRGGFGVKRTELEKPTEDGWN
jgi:hypothetical protein